MTSKTSQTREFDRFLLTQTTQKYLLRLMYFELYFDVLVSLCKDVAFLRFLQKKTTYY
jgi:hypothetical protein